jgi:hypothetical protein
VAQPCLSMTKVRQGVLHPIMSLFAFRRQDANRNRYYLLFTLACFLSLLPGADGKRREKCLLVGRLMWLGWMPGQSRSRKKTCAALHRSIEEGG